MVKPYDASLYVRQVACGGGDDSGAHGDEVGAVEMGVVVGKGALGDGVATGDAEGEGALVDAEGELIAS